MQHFCIKPFQIGASGFEGLKINYLHLRKNYHHLHEKVISSEKTNVGCPNSFLMYLYHCHGLFIHYHLNCV